MHDQTLTELISAKTNRIDFFESIGLDYLHHGAFSLKEACEHAHLDSEFIAAELTRYDKRTPSKEEIDWRTASLRELIDHILGDYHAPLRVTMPSLFDRIGECAEMYGRSHPEIHELEKLFGAFRFAAEGHMLAEEKVLFTMIVSLERGDSNLQTDATSVDAFRIRIREHDSSADDMRLMRRLTNNFTHPEDTGESYRVVLEDLAKLEQNVHVHMHLENNILFPRASQLMMETANEGSIL